MIWFEGYIGYEAEKNHGISNSYFVHRKNFVVLLLPSQTNASQIIITSCPNSDKLALISV